MTTLLTNLEANLRDEARRGSGSAEGSAKFGDNLVTVRIGQGSGRRGPNCFTATYLVNGKRSSYKAAAALAVNA